MSTYFIRNDYMYGQSYPSVSWLKKKDNPRLFFGLSFSVRYFFVAFKNDNIQTAKNPASKIE